MLSHIIKGLIIFVITILLRLFLFEIFTIPSSSMESTLQTGDRVVVNKLEYGARLPRSGFEIPWFNLFWFFSAKANTDINKNVWGNYRLPAYSAIKRGAVLVFNFEGKIFDFYIKRTAALPGDTLQIINAKLFINGKMICLSDNVKHYYRVYYSNYQKTARLLHRLNITFTYAGFQKTKQKYLLGNIAKKQIKKLEKEHYIDSVVLATDTLKQNVQLFPFIDSLNWTKDHYGPLYVPAKGDNIVLNAKNYAIYSDLIKKYEKTEIFTTDSGFYIGKHRIENYSFKQNYYFMLGDNRSLSMDSRYWGFVPESEIVGKAVLVLFSYNQGVNWSRLFKKL